MKKRFRLIKEGTEYKVQETQTDHKFGYTTKELADAAREVAEEADIFNAEFGSEELTPEAKAKAAEKRRREQERKEHNEKVKRSLKIK